jgi:hypothetical protein
MGFNLDDYIDVPERIKQFSAKFPNGSLQSEITRLEDGWLCKAYAYRTADDPRPGIGHAFEPAPGKTPYTKDSEAMNAETSAWGRAIVALGFETKNIASANEVRSRVGESQTTDGIASDAQVKKLVVTRSKLVKAGAFTEDQFKDGIAKEFGVRSTKELRKSEASELIERLEKLAKEKGVA